MIKKICKGCGEILQSEDKNKKAYIPFEKLLLRDMYLKTRPFSKEGEKDD